MTEKQTAANIIWVAGENSGDYLASEVMSSISSSLPDMHMTGIGGDRMIAAGLDPLFHSSELSVRGYVEVINHLPKILKIRSEMMHNVKALKPVAYIGVDAPDFNLKIEETARKQGVPAIHMVAPAVWAWRPQRIHQIKRSVDHLLLVFPFEEEIFNQAGIPCTYIGHPLARRIPMEPDVDAAREKLHLKNEGVVIAVLPGSRADEIKWCAPQFFGACELVLKNEPSARFVIPAADSKIRQMIEKVMEQYPTAREASMIIDGQSHLAMEAADAILVASGTATLESALYKKPMVVGYAMPAVSAMLILSKGQSRWVSLPNILAGKTLVPECLQDFCSPQVLSSHLMHALEPKRKEELKKVFTDMHQSLLRDTPTLASEAVLKVLNKS